MKVDDSLGSLYDGYYEQEHLKLKRSISARDSVDHIERQLGNSLGRTVDVGAGNGAVLSELVARKMCTSASALEISASGVDAIDKLNLPEITEVTQFDGYEIPFKDKEFDTAVCIHVIEHVEHERMILRELGRVSKKVFLEVPLELRMSGKTDTRYGHINYYLPQYFINLLETSGLRVLSHEVHTSSREYEVYCYGKMKGVLKNTLRKLLLSSLGRNVAPLFTTYLLAVVCESREVGKA